MMHSNAIAIKNMIHSNTIAIKNMIHSNAIALKYKTLWLVRPTIYISTFEQISTNTVTVNTGLNIIIFTIYLATVQLQCEIYATITN